MAISKDRSVAALPKLILTAKDEEEEFDPVTIQHWKDEGFDVSFLPVSEKATENDYTRGLHSLTEAVALGERYAIIAYGKAASVVLEAASELKGRLCAIVAYYPEIRPAIGACIPPNLNVLVHFDSSQAGTPDLRHYQYADVGKGFAERHLGTYDKTASALAWSRTLATLRKGFEIEVDLEKVWEQHVELEFVSKNVDATMSTMVAQPYVNHIPTMTGGVGYEDLHRFYRDYFIPGNPPSLQMKLLSRTVGTDRVVDEMFMSFKHTQIIPWLLPGVEPTDRGVEIALVVIVCIRGQKLYHEHIYWDQASVLVQIGLLDPKLVPGEKLFSRLPVVDGAGARKVKDEDSVESNGLISSW